MSQITLDTRVAQVALCVSEVVEMKQAKYFSVWLQDRNIHFSLTIKAMSLEAAQRQALRSYPDCRVSK